MWKNHRLNAQEARYPNATRMLPPIAPIHPFMNGDRDNWKSLRAALVSPHFDWKQKYGRKKDLNLLHLLASHPDPTGLDLALTHCPLRHRALLSEEDSKSHTPLMISVGHDRPEHFVIFTQHGADPKATNSHNQSLLHTAAQHGAIRMTHYFCDKANQKNSPTNINYKDSHGNNVLHVACLHGQHIWLETILTLVPEDEFKRAMLAHNDNRLTPALLAFIANKHQTQQWLVKTCPPSQLCDHLNTALNMNHLYCHGTMDRISTDLLLTTYDGLGMSTRKFITILASATLLMHPHTAQSFEQLGIHRKDDFVTLCIDKKSLHKTADVVQMLVNSGHLSSKKHIEVLWQEAVERFDVAAIVILLEVTPTLVNEPVGGYSILFWAIKYQAIDLMAELLPYSPEPLPTMQLKELADSVPTSTLNKAIQCSPKHLYPDKADTESRNLFHQYLGIADEDSFNLLIDDGHFHSELSHVDISGKTNEQLHLVNTLCKNQGVKAASWLASQRFYSLSFLAVAHPIGLQQSQLAMADPIISADLALILLSAFHYKTTPQVVTILEEAHSIAFNKFIHEEKFLTQHLTALERLTGKPIAQSTLQSHFEAITKNFTLDNYDTIVELLRGTKYKAMVISACPEVLQTALVVWDNKPSRLLELLYSHDSMQGVAELVDYVYQSKPDSARAMLFTPDPDGIPIVTRCIQTHPDCAVELMSTKLMTDCTSDPYAKLSVTTHPLSKLPQITDSRLFNAIISQYYWDYARFDHEKLLSIHNEGLATKLFAYLIIDKAKHIELYRLCRDYIWPKLDIKNWLHLIVMLCENYRDSLPILNALLVDLQHNKHNDTFVSAWLSSDEVFIPQLYKAVLIAYQYLAMLNQHAPAMGTLLRCDALQETFHHQAVMGLGENGKVMLNPSVMIEANEVMKNRKPRSRFALACQTKFLSDTYLYSTQLLTGEQISDELTSALVPEQSTTIHETAWRHKEHGRFDVVLLKINDKLSSLWTQVQGANPMTRDTSGFIYIRTHLVALLFRSLNEQLSNTTPVFKWKRRSILQRKKKILRKYQDDYIYSNQLDHQTSSNTGLVLLLDTFDDRGNKLETAFRAFMDISLEVASPPLHYIEKFHRSILSALGDKDRKIYYPAIILGFLHCQQNADHLDLWISYMAEIQRSNSLTSVPIMVDGQPLIDPDTGATIMQDIDDPLAADSPACNTGFATHLSTLFLSLGTEFQYCLPLLEYMKQWWQVFLEEKLVAYCESKDLTQEELSLLYDALTFLDLQSQTILTDSDNYYGFSGYNPDDPDDFDALLVVRRRFCDFLTPDSQAQHFQQHFSRPINEDELACAAYLKQLVTDRIAARALSDRVAILRPTLPESRPIDADSVTPVMKVTKIRVKQSPNAFTSIGAAPAILIPVAPTSVAQHPSGPVTELSESVRLNNSLT